ncbi:hypothetical protein F5B17DRAFT_389381 [Nemania serpens]|nr:hypothetical protein F5B17DRAFT_389381 [Nemania serpens]
MRSPWTLDLSSTSLFHKLRHISPTKIDTSNTYLNDHHSAIASLKRRGTSILYTSNIIGTLQVRNTLLPDTAIVHLAAQNVYLLPAIQYEVPSISVPLSLATYQGFPAQIPASTASNTPTQESDPSCLIQIPKYQSTLRTTRTPHRTLSGPEIPAQFEPSQSLIQKESSPSAALPGHRCLTHTKITSTHEIITPAHTHIPNQ